MCLNVQYILKLLTNPKCVSCLSPVFYHLTFSVLAMGIAQLLGLSEMLFYFILPVVCVFAAFSTTGFDQHTSLVFNPANPETSIEDCLAAAGDRVARELDTHLAAAVHTLLTG